MGSIQEIRARLGGRGIAAAGVLLAVFAAALATPQLLGDRVGAALGQLDHADPKWLWTAGCCFALSAAAAAGSWRSALSLCGGRLTLADACARFGTGSLVNTFLPARAGDAVRIGLFSRTLPNDERLLTTGGAFAALGAARMVVLSAVVVTGASMGVVPLWPLLVAAAVLVLALAAGVRARTSSAHLLDAFRALGRDRLAAVRLVGWIGLGTLARLAAATAIGTALGIHHPVTAALVIVPTLEVAGAFPVTPGNVGVTSAAVAVAFQTHGVSFTHGLAAGIAFHAVESAVGIVGGLFGVAWLAPYPSPGARRVVLVAGAASCALGVAGAFGATVLAPLV
jgi:uncharacterized membrane protein YbhN (UPF0104 family)